MPLVELERVTIQRVMDVNFWGVVTMCQTFLPELLKRPAASVVNVSSMGALVPVPGTPVVATEVFPGAIGTNISANSGVSLPGVPARTRPRPGTAPSPPRTPPSGSCAAWRRVRTT